MAFFPQHPERRPRRFLTVALRSCAASFVALLAGCGCAASAQQPTPPPPAPTAVQQMHGPLGTTEVGVLEGAPYRIDIPADWNHALVVYYHGYAQHPFTFHMAEKPSHRTAPFLERHYAVVQSAYSQPGWALPEAYPETEALRRYFEHTFGHTHEVYVAGDSMGGALVMVTLELNPRPYLGGLNLCGSVGPTFESFERRFALRAAFDHYFPGVMPPLVPVPSDYEASDAVRARISAALRANPKAAEAMRNLMGVHSDATVAGNIAYFTFVIGDMQRRAGGNPFDNRNSLYTGSDPASSTGDFELNDNVHRYAATAHAREYLMQHYTPSGHLQRPMLALHTLYDPVVPAGSLALYDHLVQASGYGENLVQQYVKKEGHCNISAEEEGRAFEELVAWTHHGQRPTPGALKLVAPGVSAVESHAR